MATLSTSKIFSVALLGLGLYLRAREHISKYGLHMVESPAQDLNGSFAKPVNRKLYVEHGSYFVEA